MKDYSNLPQTFAERLRSLVLAYGLTQRELGEALLEDASTVSLWTHGKRVPKAESLLRLADYFGVSVDFLLGR